MPPDILSTDSSLLLAAFSYLEANSRGCLLLLLSLKKIQAHKVVRGFLVETLYKEWSGEPQSCCYHMGSRALPGLEGGRSSELCLSCFSCVLSVAGKLNCHFIIAAFHTSNLTAFWRGDQTCSSTEFSEVDMKSKGQLCWSFIMQLHSPEFLFPKWYAVRVSRLILRKCMCLVSEKLPDQNHKYLRWSGRNGLLKP